MFPIETVPADAVPDRIGDRFTVRVGDLRDGHVLRVTCWHCGRAGAVYPARLRLKHGPHVRLRDLEPKFRCARCRGRGASFAVYRLAGKR